MKDHKLMYGINLRAALLSSVLIFILGFLFVPYAEPKPYELKREIVTMVEEISAQMEKFEEPPPLERPKVAVEAESEIAEDEIVETIAHSSISDSVLGNLISFFVAFSSCNFNSSSCL